MLVIKLYWFPTEQIFDLYIADTADIHAAMGDLIEARHDLGFYRNASADVEDPSDLFAFSLIDREYDLFNVQLVNKPR